MNTYGLNIPISYMWADVCRDELLIEIEGNSDTLETDSTNKYTQNK